MSNHQMEVEQGKRFEFGCNWSKFLKVVNSHSIARAEATLQKLLGMPNLSGMRFIDIGCGSGLFSLAARRLGASVHSFDYDPASVACTAEMKRTFYSADPDWVVEQGSVLDGEYLRSLGQFDIVYSWGVLHHTGSMWQALTNVVALVKSDGKLAIAVYNDQGRMSKHWLLVKKTYNRLRPGFRWLVLWPAFIRLWGPSLVRDLISGHPFHTWSDYCEIRGMSPWRDVVDWVGGYPFEVAKPEAIFEFYQRRGFTMVGLNTCGGGHGCNEFVFLGNSRLVHINGRMNNGVAS